MKKTYCEDCGEKRPKGGGIKIYCEEHLKDHLPPITHQEKLQFIKEKCIEANPELKSQEENRAFMKPRDINLADVFFVIAWHGKKVIAQQGKNVASLTLLCGEHADWNLKETFENQSGECINLIYEILR